MESRAIPPGFENSARSLRRPTLSHLHDYHQVATVSTARTAFSVRCPRLRRRILVKTAIISGMVLRQHRNQSLLCRLPRCCVAWSGFDCFTLFSSIDMLYWYISVGCGCVGDKRERMVADILKSDSGSFKPFFSCVFWCCIWFSMLVGFFTGCLGWLLEVSPHIKCVMLFVCAR